MREIVKKGRLPDPSLVMLDTQSVDAAAGVPKDTTGRDAAKKVSGRKRGLAVDVLGLVPCQATFALFTIRRRRGLSTLRLRQAM